jgi:hypothetical protein
MNISCFQKNLVFFRTMFSFLLTAGLAGLQNAVTEGRPTGGAFFSSTIQIREYPMHPKIISPTLILSTRKLVPIFFILSGLVSSCSPVPSSIPAAGKVEPPKTVVTGVLTPTLQELESEPAQTSEIEPAELFSSDQLGLCFSYPRGYTQIPNTESVEITAPDLPDSNVKGLFWLEINDSDNRTAEMIADQDMTYAAGLSVGRWTVTLGGEQAVVLDGMPGQELQRRVYIVRQQTLYILAFWPARSENKAASDQMEALYAAVTSSWAWSPCSARE